MGLDSEQERNGVTLLARLAQWSPAGERGLAALLDTDPDRYAPLIAAVAAEGSEPAERLLLNRLRTQQPDTPTLLTLAAGPLTSALQLLVGTALVERIRAGEQFEPDKAAAILIAHANRLLAVDRLTDALTVAQSAVATARQLPEKFADPALIYALNALADAYSRLDDLPAGKQAADEAVTLALRRANGMAEPVLGNALMTKGAILLTAGELADAVSTYTDALAIWREIRRHPDMDLELLLARSAGSGRRRSTIRFDENGEIDDGPTIHLAVGQPGDYVYEGPSLSYRINGVLAEDGEIYVGLRQLPPTTVNLTLAAAAYGRGRALFLMGQVEETLSALTEAIEALDEIGTEATPESLFDGIYLLAIQAKGKGNTALAAPLLRKIAEVTGSTVYRVGALVGLSNTLIRDGAIAEALDAAQRAAAILEAEQEPANALVFTVHHALARCHAAAGHWKPAASSEFRAVTAAMALSATDMAGNVTTTAAAMHEYMLAASRAAGGIPAKMPLEMRPAIGDMLRFEGPLSTTTADRLGTVGFCAVTEHALEGNLEATRDGYAAFRAFAMRNASVDSVRNSWSQLVWNVTMCFVDLGDLASARAAVDDIGALVAANPERSEYVVEHGKCASEVMAVLWNSGQEEAAQELLAGAESSLRSLYYTEVRYRDNGQSPEHFLATLDIIKGWGRT